MRQGTWTLSQKELQRVTVISRCVQGNLTCASGVGSPRKRRPPAHRQRRLRSAREGQLVQLDGSPHDWLESR
ncbi:MAG: ISNCY family transposase, partial [Candidatus Acidiferrales bacterium]